jgi:c-di-GMP-binding flagellar brake protein YcgR
MELDAVDALLRERRGSFRLRIPLRLRLQGDVDDPHGHQQALDLVDLSRDGLSAEVREVAHWQAGDRLRLRLGIETPPLAVEAEICWLRRRPQGTLVGLRFLGLAPAQRHRLDHCIGSLQRQWLRTRLAV